MVGVECLTPNLPPMRHDLSHQCATRATGIEVRSQGRAGSAGKPNDFPSTMPILCLTERYSLVGSVRRVFITEAGSPGVLWMSTDSCGDSATSFLRPERVARGVARRRSPDHHCRFRDWILGNARYATGIVYRSTRGAS